MWKQHLLKSEWIFEDVLSKNKIAQLNQILPHPVSVTDELPIAYHFLFATPSSATNDLNTDGYDSYQAPPSFHRRLWIGGSIELHEPIPLSSQIVLREKVSRIRELGNAHIVEIQRFIENKSDILLTETRKLMYLNTPYTPQRPKFEPTVSQYAERVKFQPLDLLRYSALTYNSHKIHYDKLYAQEIEQYPDLLVHGPLLATCSVNFAKKKIPGYAIKKVQYKNIQPAFVSDTLHLNLAMVNDTIRTWITNSEGELCCSSIIS